MLAYEKPKHKQISKNTVQKKDDAKPVISPNLTGIPDQMKARFEGLSGFSFNDVRVHYNSPKPSQLNALAYTQGNQVYVGPGQEGSLSHELGHVVQQMERRVAPTTSVGGIPVNDDERLEREADSFGAVAQGKFVHSLKGPNSDGGGAVVQRASKTVHEFKLDDGFKTKHLLSSIEDFQKPMGQLCVGGPTPLTKLLMTPGPFLERMNGDKRVETFTDRSGRKRFSRYDNFYGCTFAKAPELETDGYTKSWQNVMAADWETVITASLEGNYEPFQSKVNAGINTIDHLEIVR